MFQSDENYWNMQVSTGWKLKTKKCNAKILDLLQKSRDKNTEWSSLYHQNRTVATTQTLIFPSFIIFIIIWFKKLLRQKISNFFILQKAAIVYWFIDSVSCCALICVPCGLPMYVQRWSPQSSDCRCPHKKFIFFCCVSWNHL